MLRKQGLSMMRKRGQARESSVSFSELEDMPLNDRIMMGPLAKYKKYNLFPWKFLIHLIIVCLTTLQVIAIVETTGSYSASQSKYIYYQFLDNSGDDPNYSSQDIRYVRNIFDKDELRGWVQQSIAKYYALDDLDSTMDTYVLQDDHNQEFLIYARYYYLQSKNTAVPTPLIEVLNDTCYGPFANNDEADKQLNKVLETIDYFTIEYQFKNLIPEEAPATANCYLWQVMQKYDFHERGYIQLTLNLERQICTTSYDNDWNNMIWIPFLNLLFSTISLILLVKYFIDIVTVYNRLKRKYDHRKRALLFYQNQQLQHQNQSLKLRQYTEIQRKNTQYLSKIHASNESSLRMHTANSIKNSQISQERNGSVASSPLSPNDDKMFSQRIAQIQKHERIEEAKQELLRLSQDVDYELNWEDITWRDKAKIFRYWSVLTFFSNVIQIFGALFFLLKNYFGLHISEYLCGMGCMLSYFCLVQYLDYSAKYSFIIKTLSHAIPIILNTLVGILPIFIGFTMLATAIFSQAVRFQSPGYSAINLYAMMNGDQLQDVFRDLTQINTLVALIFLFVFIFFGMAVISNTFIVIVEQGFSLTQSKSRFEWLKKKNQTDDQEDDKPQKVIDQSIQEEQSPTRPGNQSVISFKDNKSIKTLQHIVSSEAKRWKEKKLTRAGSITSSPNFSNPLGKVEKKQDLDKSLDEKHLQKEKSKIKNEEARQDQKERAQAMVMYHAKIIKDKISQLMKQYEIMQEEQEKTQDYDVTVLVENEKQKILDLINFLIQKIEKINKQLTKIQ